MRKIATIMLALSINITSCSPATDHAAPDYDGNNGGNIDGNDNSSSGQNNNEMTIKLRVGESSFTATLADNAAARAFASKMPLTLTMNELNGNEKYCYLPGQLPREETNPGIINNGDLMLYGSNCVVIFYETFATGYSYTPLGKIENPGSLAAALGPGNVSVAFDR